MIVDLDMPGMNGIEVVEKTKEIAPYTEAIILTGKGSTDTAIAVAPVGSVRLSAKALQASRSAGPAATRRPAA